MNPIGFEVRTDNVLSSIYSKKISYCIELPKYTTNKVKEGWEFVGKTPSGYSVLVR